MQALIALPRGPIFLAPIVAAAVAVFPADATAQIRFTSAGNADADPGTGFVTRYAWLFAGGSAANYEINFAGQGLTTGALQNTWLALSSTRTWTLTETGSSFRSDTGTISIRLAAGSILVASFPMSLTANVVVP